MSSQGLHNAINAESLDILQKSVDGTQNKTNNDNHRGGLTGLKKNKNKEGGEE